MTLQRHFFLKNREKLAKESHLTLCTFQIINWWICEAMLFWDTGPRFWKFNKLNLGKQSAKAGCKKPTSCYEQASFFDEICDTFCLNSLNHILWLIITVTSMRGPSMISFRKECTASMKLQCSFMYDWKYPSIIIKISSILSSKNTLEFQLEFQFFCQNVRRTLVL